MDIKITQLRKMKGVSQQELADYLGVTAQAVSKWETKVTLPDITLLPMLAEYFQVTVDELLGLVPIHKTRYIPRNTDNREDWKNREYLIDNSRQLFWNDDYLEYLVKQIWKITKPIKVIEFCCCNGDLGKRMMEFLPKGSTYTGVDSECMIENAQRNLKDASFKTDFIISDIYSFQTQEHYDLSICQAALRHMNQPMQILHIMKDSVKKGGLVVCIEVNREIENVGLFVEGLDYNHLCTAFDWSKLWMKEIKSEGRDYAIGVRIPFYMRQIGLQEVDVRMNDKVSFVTPERKDHDDLCEAYAIVRGWTEKTEEPYTEARNEFMLSRGYEKRELKELYDFQKEMYQYFKDNKEHLSFLQYYGFLISFGRK